jgi:hypothetical protein
MRRRYIVTFVVGLVAICLLAGIAYNLPPVHDRVAWRVDNLRVSVRRYFNPPEQLVFSPQEEQQQIAAIVQATLTAHAIAPTYTPFPLLTETPFASPVPSLTPTPIPGRIALNGIRHEYQKFNNCAPASLSMVLSFWGWGATSTQPARTCGLPSRSTIKTSTRSRSLISLKVIPDLTPCGASAVTWSCSSAW